MAFAKKALQIKDNGTRIRGERGGTRY